MRQWTGSSLVQTMACRLFGAKPLSEPIMTYCQFKRKEHISVKYYLKFKMFHWIKCIWNWREMASNLSELLCVKLQSRDGCRIIQLIVVLWRHWRHRTDGLCTSLSSMGCQLIPEPMLVHPQFSAANLALAGFPLTNAVGESMPSRH